MYLNIERSSRGNLEISVDALNKLIENTLITNLKDKVKSLEANTKISHDNNLYLTLKLEFSTPGEIINFNEKKIIKEVEDVVFRTLNVKEKNISVIYFQ